jgi:ABC-2 type transport system permease protein
MPQNYSQAGALWAITKASFKAIFSNPSALIFSILFPIIFIMIFGAFGGDGFSRHRIGIAPDSDTNNIVFDSLRKSPFIKIISYPDTATLRKELEKGDLTGVVSIHPFKDSSGQERYFISVRSTTASGNSIGLLLQTLQNLTLKIDRAITGGKDERFILKPEVYEVKKYKQIDFILPGQLGFSILFSTLFGIAFTFYGLREQLVLKRFYASPIRRINIILGIGASRLFFQLTSVIVLILVGHYFMGFTLQHGLLTVIEMLLMTIIMLFLLMGVGLIFSSIAKTDTAIPLLINLFGFPQMLLAGTFFPIEVFPKWLQVFCNILPLTHFNNAIRKISFEGLSILDCWKELGILAIWMIVVYTILMRVIKWE